VLLLLTITLVSYIFAVYILLDRYVRCTKLIMFNNVVL